MKIKNFAQLRAAIENRARNGCELRDELETMEGWKDDGYDAEWVAIRMGYADAESETEGD